MCSNIRKGRFCVDNAFALNQIIENRRELNLETHNSWTPRKRDWNKIQASEMKYLRTVKGCKRLDQVRKEDRRNELGISPLSEKIIEFRNKPKEHRQRMENTRIPLQAYKHQPSGKRDIDRPRR
jgi:hypothetical protein